MNELRDKFKEAAEEAITCMGVEVSNQGWTL